MAEAHSLKKYLLGFDIRARQEAYPADFWLDSRREAYLLKPSVKWPLSVDDMVWPSVFTYKEFRPMVEVKDAVVTTFDRERDLGLDLSEIVELYTQNGGKNGVPIAIELLS